MRDTRLGLKASTSGTAKDNSQKHLHGDAGASQLDGRLPGGKLARGLEHVRCVHAVAEVEFQVCALQRQPKAGLPAVMRQLTANSLIYTWVDHAAVSRVAVQPRLIDRSS